MKKLFSLVAVLSLMAVASCGPNKAKDNNVADQSADTTTQVQPDTVPLVQQDSLTQDNLNEEKERLAAKYKSKIEKILAEMKEGYVYMKEAEYGETACTGNNMVYNAQKKMRKYLDYMTDEQKARYNEYKVDGPCDEDAYD